MVFWSLVDHPSSFLLSGRKLARHIRIAIVNQKMAAADFTETAIVAGESQNATIAATIPTTVVNNRPLIDCFPAVSLVVNIVPPIQSHKRKTVRIART